MSRNGSGTYTRSDGIFSSSTVWAQNSAAGTKILSARHDAHDQDLANAITASIANDGQTPITANLAMSGFKHTNVGNASARNQYAAVGQIQDGSLIWGGTTGGSATAYTMALTPSLASLVAGATFAFIAHATNTASGPTLNVNGLGAVALTGPDGVTALPKGGLVISRIYFGIYDSNGGGRIQVLNPSGAANTTWAPTMTALAPMTLSSQSVVLANYYRSGQFIEFEFGASFTTATTASSTVKIPAPVAGVAHPVTTLCACNIIDGGGTVLPGEGSWQYDGSSIIVGRKDFGTNWSLGANARITIQGRYRAV